MTQRKPTKKKLKLVDHLVGADPSLASVAGVFLYPWDRLEYLALTLNGVEPDSPLCHLAQLIERLVTTPLDENPAEWTEGQAPIIGPTHCTPAPGSRLYVVNKFLLDVPCVLRVEGSKPANGKILVRATHIPFSPFGITDPAMKGLEECAYAEDKILWPLWEVFYRGIDLTRLKRCPVCKRWFVDHTKRGNKARCTPQCTTRQWSWGERKKANHKLRGVHGHKPGRRRRT